MISLVRFAFDVPKVAGFTIARLRRSRLTVVLALGLLAGAIVTLALAFSAAGSRSSGEVFVVVAWWALGMGLLPWVGIFLGVAAVHGDLEDQTCQYLFLTPVSRPAVLVGKWLGASILAAGVACLACATVYLVVTLAPVEWDGGRVAVWRDLVTFGATLSLAMAAYAAIAALSGAWFKRPLVWAILYVVGIENIMANLPSSAGLRSLTISDPTRRLLLDGLMIDPQSQLFVVVWPAARLFPADWNQGDPMRALLWFLAIVLGAALWIYSSREYGARQD